MDLQSMSQTLLLWGAAFGLKLLGAIALWVIGRWLIYFSIGLITKSLRKRPIEPTVIKYLSSTVSVLLNITLVIAILGYFGVQTTTFAALLASAGLAIGLAWSGLLSNFAAGAFLMILRPFKVGDFITAGGVTGTVEDIGLFVTTIDTLDNVRNFVGNGKIFADNIQNFSANPYRRVDLEAQLDHSVDISRAIQVLRHKLLNIPNVTISPAPDVEVLRFSPMGPVLAVRPYCSNANYWQVYFDTNRGIREAFTEAGFPVPEQHLSLNGTSPNGVHSDQTSAATH
ncbi:MAG TPA: mechanosensitive ion channel family protein [Pyrinomonadaceae bacterium]